ncbi:MAG: DUF5786 family protein [Halobacteriales archaeon]|nr:DUF5786 family protein [Halobacteriales archaeon]
MGFGSYDESEQENQQSESDVDEDDAVSVQDAKHDGEVSYESNASSEELIDKLQEMKGDGDEEEEG